jgi:hypothetical protein
MPSPTNSKVCVCSVATLERKSSHLPDGSKGKPHNELGSNVMVKRSIALTRTFKNLAKVTAWEADAENSLPCMVPVQLDAPLILVSSVIAS